MNRVHNFSAGPAILPLEVLQQAQADLVDYQGTGASIMEKSHRGADYTQVHEEATALLTSVLGLGNDFEVLFLQGGASTQFLMAPMNLLSKGQTADYINTGAWSTKAIKEAKAFSSFMMSNILKILHPFIPFFTESLWSSNRYKKIYKKTVISQK